VKLPCNRIDVISFLVKDGLRINATLAYTITQCYAAWEAGAEIVSLFAGRIADNGVDPVSTLNRCRQHCPEAKLLWASSRQAYDYRLAQKANAYAITMAPALINKVLLFDRNLLILFWDLAKEFDDAQAKIRF
jgi:transaldolase